MANHDELNKIDLISQLEKFFKTIKKFWFAIVAGTGITAVIYLLYAWLNYVPIYQSQATFTVNSDNSNLVSGGTNGTEQVKESLPYILQSQYMKNLVMDDLEITYFPAAISLESKEVADFFVIRVTSGDADMSYQVLNSVLKNCSKASVYVLGKITVDVLDQSEVPTVPVNYLNKPVVLMRGAVIGFILCMLVVFCYALTKQTIQKEEDLKNHLNVSCVATLPQITFKKRRKKIDQHVHIYNDKVGHAFIESVRTMRTRVQRAMKQQDARVVLVTSSIPAEGKSTVAANLALSLAERGDRVVLVDLDLRNPSAAKVLGIKGKISEGVVDVLKGEKRLENELKMIKKWNLAVLFAGQPQNNPLQLMKKEALENMILRLKKLYDYVVLDTPPAAMLSDASAAAIYADCAVYVVKQDYARLERIVEGLDALTIAQVPIIGVVMNGMEKFMGGYGSYRYGNYGTYGAYGSYTENSDSEPEYVDIENPWEN